jgi:uncharacterized protein (DUF433 family)
MDADRLITRIRTNAATFAGKPTVRDTRVAVEHVLAMLADGATTEQILEEYPFLEAEDIRACLAYAWRLVSQEEIETIPRSTAG